MSVNIDIDLDAPGRQSGLVSILTQSTDGDDRLVSTPIMSLVHGDGATVAEIALTEGYRAYAQA
jgi:hypothetical protein